MVEDVARSGVMMRHHMMGKKMPGGVHFGISLSYHPRLPLSLFPGLARSERCNEKLVRPLSALYFSTSLLHSPHLSPPVVHQTERSALKRKKRVREPSESWSHWKVGVYGGEEEAKGECYRAVLERKAGVWLGE